MLRTALTSISKVNKTDVETLRTSFGVSAYLSVPSQSPSTHCRASLQFRVPRLSSCRTSRGSVKSRRSASKMRSTSRSAITVPAHSLSAPNCNSALPNSPPKTWPTRAKARRAISAMSPTMSLQRSLVRLHLHGRLLHHGLVRQVRHGTSSLT